MEELRYPTTNPDETIGKAIDFFEAQQAKHALEALPETPYRDALASLADFSVARTN